MYSSPLNICPITLLCLHFIPALPVCIVIHATCSVSCCLSLFSPVFLFESVCLLGFHSLPLRSRFFFYTRFSRAFPFFCSSPHSLALPLSFSSSSLFSTLFLLFSFPSSVIHLLYSIPSFSFPLSLFKPFTMLHFPCLCYFLFLIFKSLFLPVFASVLSVSFQPFHSLTFTLLALRDFLLSFIQDISLFWSW